MATLPLLTLAMAAALGAAQSPPPTLTPLPAAIVGVTTVWPPNLGATYSGLTVQAGATLQVGAGSNITVLGRLTVDGTLILSPPVRLFVVTGVVGSAGQVLGYSGESGPSNYLCVTGSLENSGVVTVDLVQLDCTITPPPTPTPLPAAIVGVTTVWPPNLVATYSGLTVQAGATLQVGAGSNITVSGRLTVDGTLILSPPVRLFVVTGVVGSAGQVLGYSGESGPSNYLCVTGSLENSGVVTVDLIQLDCTITPSPTRTKTATPARTHTASPTRTSSATRTRTQTPSPTRTRSATRTRTKTASPTRTRSATRSKSVSRKAKRR